MGSDSRYGGSMFSSDSGYSSSRTSASTNSGYSSSRTGTLTPSASHLVEQYRKVSLHPHDEGEL